MTAVILDGINYSDNTINKSPHKYDKASFHCSRNHIKDNGKVRTRVSSISWYHSE